VFRAAHHRSAALPKNCNALRIYAFHRNQIWHRRRSQNLVQRNSAIIALTGIICVATSTVMASSFPASGPTVTGSSARFRSGMAEAPENAPAAVKRAIWAANQLRSKRYKFGGGHRSFTDNGYDCSGTISYILGGAGLITSPMSSSDLRGFGERGRGKWITIYARKGHTFAVIAGLRLDTTPLDNSSDRFAPRWQTTPRLPYGFEARHPVGL
jgi:cell wall-associated NlpC family hydrolase